MQPCAGREDEPGFDRFLRYVTYDTQSRENSTTYPGTPGQLVLLQDLVTELHALGVADAAMDAHGYVMATISATVATALAHERRARRAAAARQPASRHNTSIAHARSSGVPSDVGGRGMEGTSVRTRRSTPDAARGISTPSGRQNASIPPSPGTGERPWRCRMRCMLRSCRQPRLA